MDFGLFSYYPKDAESPVPCNRVFNMNSKILVPDREKSLFLTGKNHCSWRGKILVPGGFEPGTSCIRDVCCVTAPPVLSGLVHMLTLIVVWLNLLPGLCVMRTCWAWPNTASSFNSWTSWGHATLPAKLQKSQSFFFFSKVQHSFFAPNAFVNIPLKKRYLFSITSLVTEKKFVYNQTELLFLERNQIWGILGVLSTCCATERLFLTIVCVYVCVCVRACVRACMCVCVCLDINV
jgi:hypothetical protein